jgi:hypothetical protein
VDVISEDDLKVGLEIIEGVHVHRVANPIKTHHRDSVLSSVLTSSIRMEQEASNIIYFYKLTGDAVDLIHAHEWLSIPPSISIKNVFDLPIILTLYSVEGHRCQDDFGPLSIAIKEIEENGIKESNRVISHSEWMKTEILRYYGKENQNKVDIIKPENDWINKIIESYTLVVKN